MNEQQMEPSTDANFYELIQQLARMIGSNHKQERRRWPRTSYRVVQRIAPWDRSGFPPEGAFFEVACRDLSRAGFSFFCPDPPDYPMVVVELGNPPEYTYIMAEVLHHERVRLFPNGEVRSAWSSPDEESKPEQDSEGGILLHLVGCRFVRRLRRPRLVS